MSKISIYYFFNSLVVFALQLFGAISYIFLNQKGYSFFEINLYLSIFWFISTVMEIPSGIFVDIIGTRKTLIISYCTRAVGLMTLLFSYNIGILILSGIFTGVAEALSSGTLDTWITNEIKEEDKNLSMKTIFSRVRTISPIIGILSGFVGAQYFANINIQIPFFISMISFFLIALLAIFLIDEPRKLKRIRMNEFKHMYIYNTRQIFDVISTTKEFWFYILLFIIPSILDVGPSNQWQIIVSNNNGDILTGYFWIFIGLTTILSNLFISKFIKSNSNTKILMYSLILVDSIIISLISLDLLPYYFFLGHVFIFGICSTLIITYIHDELIVSNELRASIISVYYTIVSMVISFMLLINGKLSDLYGIKNSWLIFTIFSVLLLIILILNR
ncbi:MFS transporter, partial [Enterococcus faecium]|nr:MFS transporter [Enterococcus faecium]